MPFEEIFAPGKLALSYELFPPKTQTGESALYEHVEKLMRFEPDFITCTYGAGGSTQLKTLEIISQVKQRFKVPVASHLTLVGSSVEQLREYLEKARENSIDYIVALRGDPPQGETEFRPAENGLSYANELVELIRGDKLPFGIAVAGYPEKHQEAPSIDIDLDNLKRKVDAGADVIISQLFYNNESFFRFRDLCINRGIEVPVIPGILPVTGLKQIQRITSMCGAELPESFVRRLAADDSPQWQHKVGVEYATEQVQELIEADVAGLHLYVLNKSEATCEVLENVSMHKVRVNQ